MPTPENFFGFFFSKESMSDMLYDNTAEEIIEISLAASQQQPGSQAFYIAAAIHDLLANNIDETPEIKEKIEHLAKAGKSINPNAPWMDVVRSGLKLRSIIKSGNLNMGFMAIISHGIRAYALEKF